MSNNINYSNKTFEEFKEKLINLTTQYYPDMFTDLSDGTIAKWLIDINASVADDLSYYSDRMFQETQIDNAKEKRSILAIAKNNGIKISSKRPSILQSEWSCVLPIITLNGDVKEPNWSVAPIIKMGTQAIGNNEIFELTEDVDFKNQFGSNGISNRKFTPILDNAGNVISYNVKKLVNMTNTETKVFTTTINESTPFMDITLPELGVVEIQSVVITNKEFNEDLFETNNSYRWYEVNNLIENKVFIDSKNSYTYNGLTLAEWVPITQKFMTEYTDSGYLKMVFGSGVDNYKNTKSIEDQIFMEQVNKIITNTNLGVTPNIGDKIYVKYRVGGGSKGNINKGTMNRINNLQCSIRTTNETLKKQITDSIKVINTTNGYLGKDEPSIEEIKYIIKYNNGAQNRCVTLRDYLAKIKNMPPKYGNPYRIGAIEDSNKIIFSILDLDYEGKLTNSVNNILISNIKEYLKEFKMINDYIEITSGKIINLSFEIDILVDSSYDYNTIVKNAINKVYDYLDIKNHNMGSALYISNIYKELSKIDGLLNIININVFNKYGGKYSPNKTTQFAKEVNGDLLIDLTSSDNVLYPNHDTMFEIKFKEEDIIIRTKLI